MGETDDVKLKSIFHSCCKCSTLLTKYSGEEKDRQKKKVKMCIRQFGDFANVRLGSIITASSNEAQHGHEKLEENYKY